MNAKSTLTNLICDVSAITTPISLRKALPSFLTHTFKKMNRLASPFLVLMLVIAGSSSLNAQLDCSGNVPIENLANGMDYTITSDGSGNVDISVTVVDNPAGLVGFLGGPGNPISFPNTTGTFTYNLTGQTPGAPYTLDLFFNWAAGGQGNSETVICEVVIDSDCTVAAAACATCPESQISVPMTSGAAFNDAGRFDGGGAPIFPDYDPNANTGTLTIEAGSNSTFVVSGVNNLAIPTDATDFCFTADLEAISGDYPFLLEFRIEQKDPISGAEVARLVFDQMIDGTGVCSIGGNISDGIASPGFVVDPANFDYAVVWALADFDGTAPTIDLVLEVSNVTLLVCVPAECSVSAADCTPCGGEQSSIDMTSGESFNDAGRFDGGGAPVFPNYDPITNTGLLTIEAGSNSTFVVSGVNNIVIPEDANDLCFTADLSVLSGDFPFDLEFRIEQKDPVTGAEVERLTLNQSINGPGVCSIGGNVSDGTASAGFVVDPANFDYALVWALADFDGTAPTEDLIVEVSNVTLLACVPPVCTISANECTACTGCDATYDVTFPNLLNLSNGPVQPNFTSAGTVMGGTLTLPAGATNVFTVAAGQRLVIPNSLQITDICATADIDVISGDFPFVLEFRVFNASTGAQLNFNQTVDGAGMCSIGGSLSDAIDQGGFTWDNSCLEFVVATAFFPGDGSTLASDRIIDISNMTLSVCTAESEQPEISCPNEGPNLFANDGFDSGDLSGWTQFGNAGVEQNEGNPLPSAFLFDFSGNFGASGLFQEFAVNEEEFYCIGADFMAIACDGGNNQIFGTDDFFELNIRYLDANGIALNGPAFCAGAPFGPLCGTGFQTQISSLTSNDLDRWLKAYGCFQAPLGTVSVQAVIAINDGPASDGGAVLVDNATFNQVIPQTFMANAEGCTANVTITDPIPTDNCGVSTFTNSFNGTEMASDVYPMGQTLVTYTATDEAGNVACCSIVIEVGDDTPEFNACPGNITLGLEGGECDEVVNYATPQAIDFCTDLDVVEVIQTEGLASGERFPIGITTNTFEFTDASGITISCSFTVEMLEFIPSSSALSCNGDLNISLDQNCEAFIGADQILEGGDYGCFDDYIVEISGISGQTITNPGTYTVTITDPDTGNSCWSNITIEDKLIPTLVCNDCPPGATMPIELPFTGTLDADSPIWTRPFGQVGNCNPSGAGVDVPYSTHSFLVVTGADSDFENVSFTAPSADFFMVLYADSFDATMPCANMVINNDDGGGGLLSQFDVMLESSTQYILVATTFNNSGNDFGDYVIELTTDAQLIDAPLECLFTCFQEEGILNGSIDVPGGVAMDNCTTNLPVLFTDVVVEGAICGSKVITRTFSILDDNGVVISSCQSEYQLLPTAFSQFITPPASISLPCGSGTSPEEIEAFFDNKIDTDGDGVPDTDINPTNDFPLGPNCTLSVVENNEGTGFGYITYPAIGCDGNEHLQAVDNNQCGFFTTFSDQVLPSCGAACGTSNVKVIRTWTILDWCNADTAPFTFTQVIKSEDNEAPTIEVANDFEVSVNPWNCLGDFSLPAPTLLHDLCSSEITYTVSGPAGTTLLAPNTTSNPSDYWIVFGAPKGIVSFTYTASDCCGNTSNAVLNVSINDTTPPVPVATENIIVNLTTNGQLDENGFAQGFAKIFTTSVDDGSFDGCSGVKIEIAREDDACDVSGNDTFNADGHPDDGSPNPNASNFDGDDGAFVMFCCADIDQVDPVTGVAFGLVPVRMRVFDDGNMTGFFGDFIDNNGDGDVLDAGEFDNFNETWVTVRVEGKAIASIVCPPDVTLACDMDYTDPAMIGTATTLSLCGSESVTTTFTPQLNACGIGFVIATYTVEGSSPSISCSQRITIENPYPTFDPNGINFPRDLPTSPTGQIACDDDVTFAPPTWTAGACDFIGYTEEVDTFFFEVDQETGVPSDACFKILRRFTVIDWCVFDETNGTDGLYEGSQVIKITDREAPVILDCVAQMFDVDSDCVRTSTVFTNIAEDNGDCASDWLKWQVTVDTWADGIVDFEYSSFLPTNDSNINNDTNGNGINDRYLAPTSSGEEVSVTVTEVIESSMFNHLITWKVTDGCGNVASCTTTFMVVDKKAPTPYCVSLSTALMQNSQPVELWAIDFDLGAFDNCTEQENLRFTFDDNEPVDGENGYSAELRSQAMQFGTAGTETINVYVWDEKGNSEFCTVSLTINDNDDTSAGSRIAGTTATELGNGVTQADVILEAVLPEYPRNQMTDVQGTFAFTDNPNGVDYEITVNKNDNHTNGVSTLDLVLIQRHILALTDLDSPYKIIAADINSDEKVSSLDVVELRKVILGVQTEFSQNTSWRFIDGTQTFADASSPWPVDETRAISNLSTNMNAEDFVAVKVGDVNATAIHNVSGATTEVRSSNTMLLEINDRSVEAGDQVEIAISSADFNVVSGLQMTVEFDGLAFNDVIGKAIQLNASNVGVISDKVITMSWNTNTAITTTDDLFVITAVATKDGKISEMIKVTDRVISPEAYTSTSLSAGTSTSTSVGSDLEINNVELGIRGGSDVAVASELMQNEPNPFKESTTINFSLAKAGKATLTIRDIAGKLIRTVKGEYTAGMNTITLEKSELNTVGVLYYTLDSGEFSKTMKMIIIE